ncbi:hypothetical protein Trco_008130 [Trichoderma cornu-damae]|uniref:Uncharacterized protein n=1 Tax=Trichoderma cornu-damae TaxID=654480 RepID=A0A9P8QEZ8_9HYPO|nr:hypothetical protein Trco_008130 [Trichoderma cornu-damae]
MPCLRGIELSLLVPPDSALLPEFPHPDASSVRVVSLGEAAKKVEENDPAPPGSDSPRIQKTTPRASVYVPSMPGTQFWVQYSVHRAPEPPCYLFFKLFINGRNITSCGIKPGTASGVITRALFEPSDKWHLKQNGKLLKISGIESRSFCFSPGPDAIAAADDGGLIEIQVFRAKSRRRSTPQLAPHRDQERYGIVQYPQAYLVLKLTCEWIDRLQQDSLNIPKMQCTTNGCYTMRRKHLLQHSVSIIVHGRICGTSTSFLTVVPLRCTTEYCARALEETDGKLLRMRIGEMNQRLSTWALIWNIAMKMPMVSE